MLCSPRHIRVTPILSLSISESIWLMWLGDWTNDWGATWCSNDTIKLSIMSLCDSMAGTESQHHEVGALPRSGNHDKLITSSWIAAPDSIWFIAFHVFRSGKTFLGNKQSECLEFHIIVPHGWQLSAYCIRQHINATQFSSRINSSNYTDMKCWTLSCLL